MPARKILVVDDDADILRMAALSLERLGGFRVRLCASAAEALDEVVIDVPDLVLLDVTMPGTDGPTMLKALRRLPATRCVPVVFFTATSNDAEVRRLRALGAAGVIAKPFDVADLPRRVRGICTDLGLD